MRGANDNRFSPADVKRAIKAAGRRLAEAGCSAKQIAAVLGHASLTEVERYTRDADQERLADAAIEALEARSGTAGVNLPSGQCQTR
jgi:integrase